MIPGYRLNGNDVSVIWTCHRKHFQEGCNTLRSSITYKSNIDDFTDHRDSLRDHECRQRHRVQSNSLGVFMLDSVSDAENLAHTWDDTSYRCCFIKVRGTIIAKCFG